MQKFISSLDRFDTSSLSGLSTEADLLAAGHRSCDELDAGTPFDELGDRWRSDEPTMALAEAEGAEELAAALSGPVFRVLVGTAIDMFAVTHLCPGHKKDMTE